MNLNIDDEKGKSLAKIEQEGEEREEKKKSAMATIVGPSFESGAQPMAMDLGMATSDGDKNLPSLPAISQQQLLQANMAAIAAHASSNQNMVADLAAALRLGGGNPAAPGLGDLAALRAQMGNDPKTFNSMI